MYIHTPGHYYWNILWGTSMSPGEVTMWPVSWPHLKASAVMGVLEYTYGGLNQSGPYRLVALLGKD